MAAFSSRALPKGFFLLLLLLFVGLSPAQAQAFTGPICSQLAQSAFAPPPLRPLSGALALACAGQEQLEKANWPLLPDPNSGFSLGEQPQRALPQADGLRLKREALRKPVPPDVAPLALSDVFPSVYRPPR